MEERKAFKPYVPPDQTVAEFTAKSIIFGALFGRTDAKEPLERQPRVLLGRHGARLGPPRQIELIGARIARIAVAGLSAALDADF